MKVFVGCVMSVGVIVTATATSAQSLSGQALSHQALPSRVLTGQVLPARQDGASPYLAVSDVGGPYAAMRGDPMPSRFAAAVLPPQEVYAIVRESGYSPLGTPQQRGLVYTMAVIDLNGEDGHLVIDARNGRIIRFMSAFRMDDKTGDEVSVAYGPPRPLPTVVDMRRVPRPPMPVPKVASRSALVPLPKAMPPRTVGEPKPAAPLAATPAPAPVQIQQSAVEQPKPAEAPQATPPVAAPAAAPIQQSVALQPKPAEAPAAAAPVEAKPSAEAKPSVQILPTQEMPKVQGLD